MTPGIPFFLGMVITLNSVLFLKYYKSMTDNVTDNILKNLLKNLKTVEICNHECLPEPQAELMCLMHSDLVTDTPSDNGYQLSSSPRKGLSFYNLASWKKFFYSFHDRCLVMHCSFRSLRSSSTHLVQLGARSSHTFILYHMGLSSSQVTVIRQLGAVSKTHLSLGLEWFFTPTRKTLPISNQTFIFVYLLSP